MRTAFTPARSPRRLAGPLLVAAAAACGGASGEQGSARDAAATPACRATVEDAVALAVTEYVKAAKPKPERFLVSVGSDSALGDAGLTALQDKGPTYLFPGDPALQATVRAQLHEKGDYTTLLVVRKSAEARDGRANVTVAGHYVGGAEDGQPLGPRSFTFGCDTTGWLVAPARAAGGA